jgi:hypothetical protein
MMTTIDADLETRKYFYEQADQNISSLNMKFREKAVVRESTKNKIINCLRNSSVFTRDFDSRFVSWCRSSFILNDIGVQTFLCDIKF